MPYNIFLTGYRGAGKTTIIKKVIRELGLDPGGFITGKEVTEQGRVSFYLLAACNLRDRSAAGNPLSVGGGSLSNGSSLSNRRDLQDTGENYYKDWGKKMAENCFVSKKDKQSLWQVNNTAFNRFGVKLLEEGLRAGEIIIMDELGRFELKAYRFQKKVEEVLRSSKVVLGVIKYEWNPFLKRIWNRPDVEVIWVDRENREEVYRMVLDKVSRLQRRS